MPEGCARAIVRILQPFPLELQRNGGKMERNSSKDDRRTETRRQVTPKGEVIVEVPFTEAQARELVALCSTIDYPSLMALSAYNLLKASLDYAVARAKRNDERVVEYPDMLESGYLDPDVAHKRRQGE